MIEYFVPSGEGEAEYTEKRSRFIGHVWPVSTEAQARRYVAEIKAKYHDARHNCWCCISRDEGVLRYSDDGEPQGTAGQPMLEVFSRGGIENVCCVVTRYFGGVLLGTGGLARAYAQAAKLALDAAGISAVRMWERVSVKCGYNLFERVKNELSAAGGVVSEVDYGELVTINALLPEGAPQTFFDRVRDISAGSASCAVSGSEFLGVPVER